MKSFTLTITGKATDEFLNDIRSEFAEVMSETVEDVALTRASFEVEGQNAIVVEP